MVSNNVYCFWTFRVGDRSWLWLSQLYLGMLGPASSIFSFLDVGWRSSIHLGQAIHVEKKNARKLAGACDTSVHSHICSHLVNPTRHTVARGGESCLHGGVAGLQRQETGGRPSPRGGWRVGDNNTVCHSLSVPRGFLLKFIEIPSKLSFRNSEVFGAYEAKWPLKICGYLSITISSLHTE